MIKQLVVAGLVGGVVLFIWSGISWMALSWHDSNLHSFADEDIMAETIRAHARSSGMYILPGMPKPGPNATEEEKKEAEAKAMDRMIRGPHMFASVRLTGTESIAPFMVRGFILGVISVGFVAWLLSKTQNLTYFGKVIFTTMFAVAASFAIHLQYWNWWSFSTGYTFVSLIDMALGWFLVGLVLGKLIPGGKRSQVVAS